MPAQHDGRLLNNLINREKEATQAFKQYSLNSGSAAAALSTWSTADSANTTDIMDASTRITQLMSSLTDTQRSYLNALTLYRSSLKEVHGREIALKTVVRDREILVNRVIKLGNKKPKDEQLHSHQLKLEDAQRELTACETFLQEEEIALSELKRRSFREALAHRMKSMGELGRVMEDVALESLDVLAQLDGPDNGFNPDHYRDDFALGSDAGESIAPFDSASQAMSRASSSASLDEDQQRDLQRQQHENAPALPTSSSRQVNGAHLRQSTTDSLASPAASRAPSNLGGPPRSSIAPSAPASVTPSQSQPIMPPVPTAPRPISTVAYTERQEGLPTFEIPKAPDLSRRPDDSSDDEEPDDREELRSVTHTDMMNNGVPSKLRSRSYPLDSPGLATTQQRSSGFNLSSKPSIGGGGSRRRAMSDASSMEDSRGGGGRTRKRSGSFFGGIAGLFKRKNKKDRDEEEEDSQRRDDPEMDYYEGRNRLAGQNAQQFNSRSDADVLAAVMGAGVRQSSGRRGGGGRDDSSDDDEPRNVIKHRNDPKQRIKAMSEIGRSSSNLGSTRGGPPPSSSNRPTLSRKGTSNSTTGRPMSMIVQPVARPKFVEKKGGSELGQPGGGEEKKKKTKKVKKAASDIGYSGGNWVQTSQNNSVAFPSSTSTPHVSAPPPVPNVAPVAPTGGDSSSIKKKKKKSVKEPSETVILSAEALGIPSPAAGGPTPQSVASPAFAPARPPGISRSNTVTSSTSTSAPVKMKKKKKSASVAGSIAEEPASTPSKPLPTADDLAKTLPTARSSSSAFTTQLPRPDDDPYNSGSTRSLSTAAPQAQQAQPPAQPTTSLAVKSAKSKLAADEKRNKRHSQLHGEGNWVSLPPSAHPVGQQPSTQSNHTRSASASRSEVHEGDESLLAAVERAGMIDSAKPSRTYTGSSSKPNSGTSTPSKQPLSSSVSTPILGSNTQQSGLTSSPSAGPAWVSGEGAGGGGGLSKRKSVRLAENSNLSVPSPNPHHVPTSPASSVRGASPPPQPKPILVNSPARGGATSSSASAGGDWPTRASIRASMIDSSDEEDGDGGYMAARRMLRKETKSMNEVFGNGGTKVDKGKGKAV
ncbi:uncharacterized protein JCM6883_006839 [Sporobolomyces salmoneus]|uniref:uncharacterized protein n=1 Tax=Sporobolomyces salmoneus TaxID=183962 RepID=UPI0031801638